MPSKLLKPLIVIAVLLGLTLLAVVILHRPGHPAIPFAKYIDQVERIQIQRSSEMAELTREGSDWKVGNASGTYKADPEKMKAFLEGLKSVSVEDIIAERSASAVDFDITPASGTRVRFLTKTGAVIIEGVFGKQAPDIAHTYFQYADNSPVFLARAILRIEPGQSQTVWWRDRALFAIAEDQVLTLYIEGPGFKTALARSSDTWTCNGKQVEPAPVWGLLGVITHLRADDFVDSEKSPSAVTVPLNYAAVTLQLRDGSTHVLRIGRLPADPLRHPVTVGDDGPRAWVNAGAIQSILQKPSEFKPPAKKD